MIENPIIARVLKISIRLNVLLVSLLVYRNPVKAVSLLKRLALLLRSNSDNSKVLRLARSGNRVFMAVNVPGWPSKGFNRFIKNEISRTTSRVLGSNTLQTVIFGITNRCSLKCEHCSNALNTSIESEKDSEKLNQIVRILKKSGVRHIQFTGGEPLEVFDTLLGVIKVSGKMDSWVLTSGFGLTEQKAMALKHAGLSGVNISLDHWDESKHNHFRGNNNSYSWVKKAVVNSKKAGLVVSLSLCSTRDFSTRENLNKYIQLAEEWGAQFIRILEPKQSGSYANNDIRLDKDQLNLLENIFIGYNSGTINRKQPILMYPDLRNRKKCIGKGDRYIYIDMEGNVHPCPFALNGTGNILEKPIDEILKDLIGIECINCNHIN